MTFFLSKTQDLSLSHSHSPCEALRDLSQCAMNEWRQAISELTLATALSEKYPAARLPRRPPSSRELMYELPMRKKVSSGPIPQHLPLSPYSYE